MKILIPALFFLALGGNTFALPTVPLVSGVTGDFKLQDDFQSQGYSFGPYFSDFSNASSSCEGHHEGDGEEHGDEHCDGPDDESNGPAPVPEPASALLMSLGLTAAAYLKRRRK